MTEEVVIYDDGYVSHLKVFLKPDGGSVISFKEPTETGSRTKAVPLTAHDSHMLFRVLEGHFHSTLQAKRKEAQELVEGTQRRKRLRRKGLT